MPIAAEIIERLKSAGFGLGGSRFMAAKYPDQIAISDKTDWDFYCADLAANRDLVLSLGFERIACENKNYWDDLLADIFKHPDHPIEVLIRTDVGVYSRTFDGISAEFFKRDLWKSSPLADPETPKAVFANKVCRTFNALFRANGYVETTAEEFPF